MLQDAVDKYALPEIPDYCQDVTSQAAVRRTLTYAHKLSYTSFAPLDYTEKKGLRQYRPPRAADLADGAVTAAQLCRSEAKYLLILRTGW